MLFKILYPDVCGICEKSIKSNTYACTKCLNILKYYRERKIKNNSINYCDEIFSLYPYKGEIKNRICKFKFQDKKYIGKTFGYLISQKAKYIEFDYIIPVPISKKRLMERGYNQSKIMTDEISKILTKKALNNVLIKIKNNERQSDLHELERRRNVNGVYKVKNEAKIKDKIILLVDDVCTTASTLNECAKVLKIFGAKKVIAITVAYA